MGCWWTEKNWGRMAFRSHHDQTFTIKATGTNQVLLSLFSSLCPTIVSPLFPGFSLSRLAKTSALSRTFHWGHLLKCLSRFCGSHPLSSWTGWDAGPASCVTHSRRLSTLLIRHRVQVAVKHYTHTHTHILSTNKSQKSSEQGKSASVRWRNLTRVPYWNN